MGRVWNASSLPQTTRLLGLGLERRGPPCTGTIAGGCRTSLMVQKKPGMERRLHSMDPNFTQGMKIGLKMGIPTTQVQGPDSR